jgi:hypothetical protein
MATLLSTIAILFRGVARAKFGSDEHALTAKVTARGAGTATLTLCVMPKETRFELDGDVAALSEGDIVTFHLKKNMVVLKGREIHISKVAFVP